MMKNIIKTSAPLLLTLLFVYAGVSKLLTFKQFSEQLHRQPIPHWMAGALPYALIPGELFIAVLLCFSATEKTGLRLSAGLLLLFSGYIALALLHIWARTPCSCGGMLTHMSWGAHLIFNLCFTLLAMAALCIPDKLIIKKQG